MMDFLMMLCLFLVEGLVIILVQVIRSEKRRSPFGSDASRRGVDVSSYPSARTFNFGIQLSF